MALRAREGDENGIEWSGEKPSPGRLLAGIVNPKRKPIEVRPAEKNVATRKGRARGGKLSVFPHLTLITTTST